MGETQLVIKKSDVQKLVKAACPEAALLYLYLQAGNPAAEAKQALGLDEIGYQKADAVLTALGFSAQTEVYLPASELPSYTPQELTREFTTDGAFSSMIGQIQRRLGRLLSTEEIKIFLGIYRHLGMCPEVISILVSFCVQKSSLRGGRTPSIRMIEKEAYHWSELGIETMEQAAEHMQSQLVLTDRQTKICRILQLGSRKPTAGEEKYLQQWIDWGFSDEVLSLAYEKTCMGANGMKWPYMHAILKSWHESGFSTVQQIEQGDRKRSGGRQAAQKHDAALSELEKDSVRKLMKKGLYEED